MQSPRRVAKLDALDTPDRGDETAVGVRSSLGPLLHQESRHCRCLKGMACRASFERMAVEGKRRYLPGVGQVLEFANGDER